MVDAAVFMGYSGGSEKSSLGVPPGDEACNTDLRVSFMKVKLWVTLTFVKLCKNLQVFVND